MITVVQNDLIDGLSSIISVAQVKKHFPSTCPDCPHGNLAQTPHPRSSDRDYIIGETLSLDVLEVGSTAGKAVLTHSGEGYAVVCIDRGSGMS